MKKYKYGVSIMVLVISIIVMIILAGTVIISLNNTNVLNKSKDVVKDTNLYQAQQMANTIWADAYLDKSIDIDEIYIREKLKEYDIDADQYDIDILYNGVKVSFKGEVGTDEPSDEPQEPSMPNEPDPSVPEAWRASVSKVTDDGVPIPKGFVMSPYDGENEKNEGLVIYALTTTEIANGKTDIKTIDGTKQVSLENRNQFVWIPVDPAKFKETFVRSNFGSGYVLTDTVGGSDHWELELDSNNMPLANQGDNNQYISNTTLAEATAMYESVKKYGGFYIARYEAGGSTATNNPNLGYLGRGYISVTMGKYPYGESSWGTSMTNEVLDGGAVTLSRSLYPATGTVYGAVSTLVYGVQWDRTVSWFQELDSSIDIHKGYSIGQFKVNAITETELNEGAKCSKFVDGKYGEWQIVKEKPAGAEWLFTTGAYKKACVFNIYDMAGGVWEWTMEGCGTDKHNLRGGTFKLDNITLIYRGSVPAADTYRDYGFRPALYIK